jgi:hypothetical protein
VIPVPASIPCSAPPRSDGLWRRRRETARKQGERDETDGEPDRHHQCMAVEGREIAGTVVSAVLH